MLPGNRRTLIAAFMLLAFLTGTSWIGWLIVGMGSITRGTCPSQLPGTPHLLAHRSERQPPVRSRLRSRGSARRIIPEQPVAFTREQDLVWRIVGRPGVVLL